MAGILLNRSRQVPAEDTPAFGGIAERFRRAGDLDRAIALCRDGLKKFPDQLSARVTLGWSLLDKGQYEEARAELERVLRRAPDNLAAIRGLAELHDRSEGAMPSMDDSRESWRPEDSPSSETVGSAPATGAAVGASGAPPAMAEDPFAPISVNFSASSSASPEIVHTAEDAGRAAQEAAASAAAMSLLGSDRVAVEQPASAAMAASLELEVTPFETGQDAPVALDADLGSSMGSAFELESAADNLLSAAGANDHQPHAFAEAESDLAETEELVASLQQFSVDEVAPVGDLLLEVPGAGDESGLVDLAAFEASPVELAPALDTSSIPDELDAPMALADAVQAGGPAVLAASDPQAQLEIEALPDTTTAAFAETDELDSLTASIAEEAEAPVLLASASLDAATPAMHAPMGLEAGIVESEEVGVVAAPLTDVPEVQPEPAFVPDLAFALARSDDEDVTDLASEMADQARVERAEPELVVVAAEPEFTPDLSGMALDGHGYDALIAGQPMAIESPAADVLAHADLAEAEPEFVPDLSAVALDGAAADALSAPVVTHEEIRDTASASPASEPAPAFVPDLSYAFDMAESRGQDEVAYTDSAPAQVVAIAQPRPAILALERFLRQVEARKLHLAQGSVA